MWPDFEHLLSHSWSTFLAGQGTTSSGFLSPYLVALGSGIIVALAIFLLHGRQAMREHWKKNVLIVLCAAIGGNIIVYGPLFGWSVIKTIYQDQVSLVSANTTLQKENAALRSSLASLQAQQPKSPREQPEAPNSLRRRIKRLANDIEAFLNVEQEKQRQFMLTRGGDPNALREFQIESQARFVSQGLKERTVQIAHELEAKGLPLGLGLQYVSQNGYFGLDIEHLRDLAYRVDKDGDVISF